MGEYSKKLHVQKDNENQTIQLYDNVNDVGTPALRIKDENNTVYAKLNDLNNYYASFLHCHFNNTNYTVSSINHFGVNFSPDITWQGTSTEGIFESDEPWGTSQGNAGNFNITGDVIFTADDMVTLG